MGERTDPPSAGDTEASSDSGAAVVGTAVIEIAAPVERVWDVLTAIDRWPSWNPDVKSTSVSGEVAPGTTFRWKAGPGTITSTIRRVEPPTLIGWTGKTLGLRARHVYRLEDRDGRTIVWTEESFEGLLARVLRRPLRKTLEGTLADGLRHLKVEAERLSP